MKRAVEVLFLIVIAAAALFLVLGGSPAENRSEGGPSGGTFEVEVLSLSVSPTQPMVGQAIQVVAVLKNIGDRSGTYQAQLRIDGEVKYTLPVELAPGQIQSAQFTGSIATPGDHIIQVDDRSTTITVVAPPTGLVDRWNATIRAPE
ncbi:MAG: CARDB domain-containing protein [Candidatus Hadarchaeales archaeon]